MYSLASPNSADILIKLLLGIRKGTEPVATPGWQFHNQVLSKLIRLRGSEQFTTRSGRNLFVIIFTNVVS